MGVCIGYSYPCFVFGLARNMRVSDGMGLRERLRVGYRSSRNGMRMVSAACARGRGALSYRGLAGEPVKFGKKQARVHNGRGVGACVSGNGM